jgi:hypothetical protein
MSAVDAVRAGVKTFYDSLYIGGGSWREVPLRRWRAAGRRPAIRAAATVTLSTAVAVFTALAVAPPAAAAARSTSTARCKCWGYHACTDANPCQVAGTAWKGWCAPRRGGYAVPGASALVLPFATYLLVSTRPRAIEHAFDSFMTVPPVTAAR